MSWTSFKFEDLYSEPSRNGVYKPPQFHGTGVKIVNMGELFGHDIISKQEMNRLSMNDAEMERFGLAEGDLLFGRRSLVEEGAGKSSLVEGLSEPTTFESSIIRVRVNESLIRPRFLFYWLKSHRGKGAIRAIVTGTNVKGIKGSVLRNISIECPDTNYQDTIISMLRTYDDLIENNRRRIQLLEEAARLLYREWFVHLRFPGHEHCKIKDGVPEGWEKASLKEVSESVNYGFTASATQEPVGPKFLRITDIVPNVINWKTVPFCEIEQRASEKFSLKKGDVVVARTGATVGYAKRIGNIDHPSVFASYLVRFRFSHCIENVIPGIFMESDEFKTYVLNNAGGAAQPNANANILSSATILVPTKNVQIVFRDIVGPMFEQRDAVQKMNSQLAEARDILLPRLMNEEIIV